MKFRESDPLVMLTVSIVTVALFAVGLMIAYFWR
jgi:hypothetical protein